MCPLCLGEEDVNRLLLRCPEARQWRREILDKKSLNMEEDVAYKEILTCVNNGVVRDLGSCLDKVKRNLLNAMKICKRHVHLMTNRLPNVAARV
jgi:hypothetical protein